MMMMNVATAQSIIVKKESAFAGFRLTKDGKLLNTVCVESIDEILALESDWLALEAQCPNTVLFQSYNWCRNYIGFASSHPNFRPVVVTIYDYGKLVALLPLCVQFLKGMKLVTGLTEPYQQYTELLLAPEISPEDIRDCLVACLKSMDTAYLHFGQVREDGALAQTLKGVASCVGEKDAAPYVDLADWPDFATYYTSVNAKTRKNMRNAKNRLEHSAPVCHQSADHGELLCKVIDRSYLGREKWLEQMGITSRAFRDTEFKVFLERFKCPQTSGVKTLATTLCHGETSMADQWGFVYRGRYYAFMATWNPDYEASSPGKLHLGEIIQTCYERQLDVADFMISAVSYKFTWANKAAPVRDYVLAFSFRGWLHTQLWLKLARPLAKKMVTRMPKGLRAVIVGKLQSVME